MCRLLANRPSCGKILVMENKALADQPETESTVHVALRLRLPAVWLVILLLAAVVLPSRVWNTLLVGLGGMFIVAYLWVRLLAHNLHATRRLRFGWVSVGDRLEETFELSNNGVVPALWVEVQDDSNVPGYSAAVVRSVGENQVDRWRQSAICRRRGQFHLGPWRIRSSDPFGIFMATRHYPATREIIIHPPIYGNLPIALPAGQSSGRAYVRRAWQATINAATVRAYQPGDPFNRIHWPTSARRDELFARQFDLDASGDVWLLLDMQAATQVGESTNDNENGRYLLAPERSEVTGQVAHSVNNTEEQAVLLAASLAAEALRQNRAVGLAAYGRTPHILPPARGQGQEWKILRALALVNADGQLDLAAAIHDLGRIARRGTTAVIITPSGSAEWLPALLNLARQGVQSSVILLDRASFGGEGYSQGLCDAVQRLGFTCYLLRRGDLGQPLEEQAHRGFWEFRVTGMGKVVVIQNPLNDR